MNLRDLQSVRAILFDLDGTLLNVEMNAYIFGYAEGLARCFADLTNRCTFANALMKSAFDLLNSDDETRTNEEFFLGRLSQRLGISPDIIKTRLEAYYYDGLQLLAPLVRPFPLVRRILGHCFANDLEVVIATNPVFPRPVVDARIDWGRLSDFPFHMVTSYENCRFCKPHPRFFRDILNARRLQPNEALMVGNDAEYDLPARNAGIPTFLLDSCPGSQHCSGVRPDFRGSHEDLLQLLRRITESSRNN
jgi:FMN phosphatase YigB (HAD superfamily)